MRLTVREIAEAAGGKVLCGNPETICLHLCTDSRTVQEGDLFCLLYTSRKILMTMEEFHEII